MIVYWLNVAVTISGRIAPEHGGRMSPAGQFAAGDGIKVECALSKQIQAGFKKEE
jgi:hypothetical protein